MRAIGAALSVLLMGAEVAFAAGPPRQATVSIEMPAADGESGSKTVALDGGTAEVEVTAVNADDGRTVEVRLRFSYDVPPDTIALDEIVHHISFATIGEEEFRIGTARLRTGDINLNPDGPELVYRVTLYRPETAYRVRVRVFGNYE